MFCDTDGQTIIDSYKMWDIVFLFKSGYLCELSQVVECSKGIKLLQGQNQSLMRRRVHEVKVNEVIDTWG